MDFKEVPQHNNALMPYYKSYHHIVFRTKNSIPSISETYETDVYKYIWGIIKNVGGHLYRINSMPDHVHLLVEIPPTIALSDFVKKIKQGSGNYMRSLPDKFPKFTAWGKSYCAITYSEKEKQNVINYIINQKEHHKKESFREELIRIFQEESIDYNLEYLLPE